MVSVGEVFRLAVVTVTVQADHAFELLSAEIRDGYPSSVCHAGVWNIPWEPDWWVMVDLEDGLVRIGTYRVIDDDVEYDPTGWYTFNVLEHSTDAIMAELDKITDGLGV